MKRDLNLIPKAENQSSVNKFILPVLLMVVLYAATAYLAITIPNQQLQEKENEYAVLQQKVDSLQYVESEYQQIRSQLSEIESKKQTILRTEHSDKDPINLLAIIEQACPEDITLTNISITTDGITINGTSSTDSLIAEFMVNLRANELFSNSNISLVEPSDASFAQIQESLSNGTEIPEMRKFQLALTYSAGEMLEDIVEANS